MLSTGITDFGGKMTRRDFLRAGSVGATAVGLALADLTHLDRTRASTRGREVNCIILFLVGGPGHLDTWDLKPAAPSDVRGPFRPIHTNVPGIHISEHFPLMAKRADRYALIRSVRHEAAAIHETGQQMMQTGFLFPSGQEWPHYGAALSYLRGHRTGALPPFVVLPGPIGNTGVSVSHGQGAGYLGVEHEPFFPNGTLGQDSGVSVESEPLRQAFDLSTEPDRDRYGASAFGQSCLLARRLVEHGVGLVTVNMASTVYNEITWDCHKDGGALDSGLDDYKNTLCPIFDQAYTSLLDDLHMRGMLESTLVVAMGEFGRTPYLNARGGRDHWPGCWTILFAGGGVKGGQVIGSSDRIGSEPKDRPVSPAEVAASIYTALGIELDTKLPGLDHRPTPLVLAPPVQELFQG